MKLRPRVWPRIVAFDSTSFRVSRKHPITGNPIQGGSVVFNILGAYGWESPWAAGHVLALRAAPNFGFNQGTPPWLEFFRELEGDLSGQPWQFVTDKDRELIRALDLVWPRGAKDTPDHFVCHWHLRKKPPQRPLVRRARLERSDLPDDDPRTEDDLQMPVLRPGSVAGVRGRSQRPGGS